MCVWRKVETVIHDQSQSPQSKSLGLEEMPDEVGHCEAASGAHDQHTSGTHGKTVGGQAPMSWSFQRAELPQQGCGDRFLTVVDDDTNVVAEGGGDTPSLRRAPHSQECSERLQTLTSQVLINA